MGVNTDGDYKSIAPHLYDAQGRRRCGFINLSDADGLNLFQNADGHSILPGRVAAYQYMLNAIISVDKVERAIIPNTYIAEASIYHGICCLREEVSRERNSFQLFYTHWDSLTLERQGTVIGRVIDNKAKDWRFRGDIHFLKSALYWQPESVIGSIYRKLTLERTAASIALAGEHYRQRLANLLPELQAISPDALTMLQLDQPVPDITIDPDYAAALRGLCCLPISEREMGFFNAHLEQIDTHGIAPNTVELIIPDWIPDSNHPAKSLNAINHGQLRWQGHLNGQQVSLNLDLNTRCFESTVIDKHLTITHKIYEPIEQPTRDNYFMPGYRIRTYINDVDNGTAEMAAGCQSPESVQHLRGEFRTLASGLMQPLTHTEGVLQVFPKVVADIQQQRTEFYTKLGNAAPGQQTEAQQMRESLDKMLAPRLLNAGYSTQTTETMLNETVHQCLAQGASSVAFAGYDAERRQIVVQTNLPAPITVHENIPAKLAAEPSAGYMVPLPLPPGLTRGG